MLRIGRHGALCPPWPMPVRGRALHRPRALLLGRICCTGPCCHGSCWRARMTSAAITTAAAVGRRTSVARRATGLHGPHLRRRMCDAAKRERPHVPSPRHSCPAPLISRLRIEHYTPLPGVAVAITAAVLCVVAWPAPHTPTHATGSGRLDAEGRYVRPRSRYARPPR